jgi:hypothetical protein
MWTFGWSAQAKFLIVNLFWIWDVAIAVQPKGENHLAVKVTEGVVRVDAIV